MKLTRTELYDLVWSKPLITLAQEFSISDNGLRKICTKYEIPLPKMGYWQKLQFGKEITKDELPTNEKWNDTQILISGEETDNSEEHYLSKLRTLTKEIRRLHPKRCNVPNRLTDPDPLITAVKADLESKKEEHWRTFKTAINNSKGFLSINVAKENVPRALRIMDCFIKLAKVRGHQFVVNDQGSLLIVDGEKYKIRFREKGTRTTYPDDKWRSDLVPNGILSLKLDDLYHKEWNDGKTLLEEQLPKIIAAFEIRAENDKIEQAKRKAYWAERDRLEAIRKVELAKLELEKKKVDLLKNQVTKWKQSNELENFIGAVELLNVENKEEISEWIVWAKEQQKALNPLSGNLEDFVRLFEFGNDAGK